LIILAPLALIVPTKTSCGGNTSDLWALVDVTG